MPVRMQQSSLQGQKVKAYMKLLQENENFWNALLVFLGALFILSAIPFFPLYIVPVIALICGATAYVKKPYAGTLLSIILAFLAMLYQSPVLGLVFLLVVAITLFEMFEKWGIISALQILIFAPFAPYPLSLISGFVMLGMIIAALHFGSKKSILISIPAVLMVLLLSALWLQPTSSFFYLSLDKYSPAVKVLQISKDAVPLGEFFPTLFSLPAHLADLSAYGQFSDAMGRIGANLFTLLFYDSGLIQLVLWSITLFVVSFLSGKIKKFGQTISSLFLFLMPLSYYFLSKSFAFTFEMSMFGYAAISIGIVAVLEFFNISFSKESELQRKDKAKTFGKFGLQDMSFGKGAKSLDDIGNYDDVKDELRSSMLLPLERKEIAYTYGLKPPSGILLFGPPGTGKTMLMRAFASELGYAIYYVKSSDILSQWYGESEKNISEIFTNARKRAPCILFFDEIDSIGKKRTEYGVDDVGPRILSVLLQEMDGFKSGKSVIVVGATNVPQKLDPALMRPGRFDKVVYMHLPDLGGRKEIFRVHLEKVPCSPDVDLEVLAAKTERFSGADIKNIVTEATGLAAKEAAKLGKIMPITQKHLMQVLRSIRPSTSLASLDDYEQFKLDFERRVGREEPEKKEGEKVKWDDVAGLGEVKQALLEAIELPLLREDLVKEFKIKPSKGILLFGPPGTGKTLIAKAASSELKSAFIPLSGAELMKRGYSNAVNVLRETFNRARENKPAIIFIDEIETIAPSRDIAPSDIVGQLLNEMDGMKSVGGGVVVVAATNKPSILDPAILRPGRFDKLFYVSPPDSEAREMIFKIHLGKFSKGLDMHSFAIETEDYTGADIASICQEVKMRLLREKMTGKVPKASNDLVLRVIHTRRPSINEQLLQEYERFLEVYGERK